MKAHHTIIGARPAQGFSLIELMTAITIGMLLLMGLASVFVNSSQSYRELKKTSEQIENGRYAIELLGQDIRHAGFYGDLSKLPAAPGSAPDPCSAPSDAAVSDTVNNFLTVPLQIYPAATLTSYPSVPTACASLLPNANLMPGSDIIVVRRADSNLVSGTVTANTWYLQTTPADADLQKGVAGTITNTQNARGASSALQRRNFGVAASGTPPQFPLIAATIRRYRTHIYFVAPCSVGTGTGGICTSSDDQSRAIPTLKRIELDTAGNFTITPLVEGIQTLRLEVGIDNSPTAVDPMTLMIGDGTPDSFSHSPSLTDTTNVVAARLYVLARNTESTPGYVDNKLYTLGTVTTTAANDAFKRHVYEAEMRVVNQSGRREIPR